MNNKIIVKYDGIFFNTRLSVTDKEVIFEKKGLLKKEYITIDIIDIEDVMEVTSDDRHLTVTTSSRNYSLVCKNLIDTKRIKEEIANAKQKNKINKISNGIVKGIGTAVLVAGTLVKNRETIFKTVGTIKELFDKRAN